MYNVIFLNVGDINPPVVQPTPDASLRQCHYCKFAVYYMGTKLKSLDYYNNRTVITFIVYQSHRQEY